MPKKIILDTNFLLIPAIYKVDIFSEIDRIADFNYKVAIVDKTIDELNNLTREGKGKDKAAAKLALQLIESQKIPILITKKDKHVDSLILDLADKDTIVATQDLDFRRKLGEKGIKTIVLRQKTHLVIQ